MQRCCGFNGMFAQPGLFNLLVNCSKELMIWINKAVAPCGLCYAASLLQTKYNLAVPCVVVCYLDSSASTYAAWYNKFARFFAS